MSSIHGWSGQTWPYEDKIRGILSSYTVEERGAENEDYNHRCVITGYFGAVGPESVGQVPRALGIVQEGARWEKEK